MTAEGKKQIVVAVCGASGSIYALRLLSMLAQMPVGVHLIVSPAGRQVMETETDFRGGSLKAFLEGEGIEFHRLMRLTEYEPDNFSAPPASGSFTHDGMVIVPCSMNTLAAVSAGITHTLIHRAADVCLKEKRPLILAIRETPFNRIHLRNMETAAAAGATIMPLSPGFYFRPASISELVDAMADRVLHHLGVGRPGAGQWGSDPSG